ncbi:MAG: hypothetical protein SVX43_21385 [Cyanobacteriota bacterium]|nr:hypothetical protein [Cyanobacteriota bacterium]
MSKLDRIVKRIEMLPGDRVKAIVLDWLTASEGRFEDFAEKLADERIEGVDGGEDTDIDTTLGFPNLTAEEMRQEDLKRWEDYRLTGHGIPHHKMEEWADSLGTDNPLPCPK